ncbi:hypothetical protein [Niastella vici]|nr:hypothetical protein [Niastella vici]
MEVKNSFQRIDDKYAAGTSLIMNRNIAYVQAPIGDFLSRIWNLYGKPTEISYEGFGYTFKDVKTGLIFTVYSAGSGPAYGGDDSNKDKLLPIITRFDNMLTVTDNADCEITVENDFGTMKTGSKNGVPYDKMISE